MQLSDLIELEAPYFEMSVSDEQPEQTNNSQSQDAEQAENSFDVKSVCQDTLEHMQIEALKDTQSMGEAFLLLKDLRNGLQISQSVHERLSKALKLLSKSQEAAACHQAEIDGMQSSSQRCDIKIADETLLTAGGMKVPKRQSASRPFKHPSSKRQQLTPEEAAEIYSMRPEFAKGSTLRKGCMIKSKMVAPHFGVTPKTVRDIWHTRTWVTATRHLWTEEEISHHAKGFAESRDEDAAASAASASHAGSMVNMNLAHNWMALSSLQNQAMMGGMYGLPFHLSYPSSPSPSSHAQHFSVEQQHAAMSGLISHGIYNALATQHAQMGFVGRHPGFGGAHHLVRPEVSASRKKSKQHRSKGTEHHHQVV